MSKLYLPFLLFFAYSLSAQDEIFLNNPSFEENFPRLSFTAKGWNDCGFPGESVTDIHPVPDSEFGVDLLPADGQVYLGMVVRENETFEAVGQKLPVPLKAGSHYVFEIYLTKAPVYESSVSGSASLHRAKVNFSSSCILRIFGGDKYCQRNELLAESAPVNFDEWVNTPFFFKPNQNHEYLTFEAFYSEPTVAAYNGNMMLDGASTILEVDSTGNFFPDSTYSFRLPEGVDYDPAADGDIYRAMQTSSPSAYRASGPKEVLPPGEADFYSEQMTYVIFQRGMTNLEKQSEDALYDMAQRIKADERKLFIRFKGSSQFLTPLRRSTVRDILLRAGLPATRFSFGTEFDGDSLLQGGSRDVEFIVY